MRRFRVPFALVVSLIITAVGFGWATPAHACGGFFCSRVPVDQTGEHIVFAVDDGEVEAHVLIQYEGEAENFAWIVPTPSEPEIGLSSPILFDVIRGNAPTTLWTAYETVGDCRYGCPTPRSCNGSGFEDMGMADMATDVGMNVQDASAMNDTGAGDSGVPPVVVVDQSVVGAFETATLRATEAEPLLRWLQNNDYDIPDTALPLIEPYIVPGGSMHFVAFRLRKYADVGELQPIRLRFAAEAPMIPLQLTAIASAPNLEVTAHILADGRAFPANFANVTLNPLRLDWLDFNLEADYEAAIGAAIDEAGGHAFVTEYAGPLEAASGFVSSRWDTEVLAEIDDAIAFLDELQAQGFPASSALLSLLERFLPVPDWVEEAGYTAQNFYDCLFANGRGGGPGRPGIFDMGADASFDAGGGELPTVRCFGRDVSFPEFDGAAFAAAIETRLIEPLYAIEDLFVRHDYVTRLTTRLDPDEMTADPGFAILPDAPDVEAPFIATRTMDCGTFPEERIGDEIIIGGDAYQARNTLRMPGLDPVYVREAMPELPAESGSDTAALRVERLVDGEIVTEVDHAPALNAAVAAWNGDREEEWAPQPLICPYVEETVCPGSADSGSSGTTGDSGTSAAGEEADGVGCAVAGASPTLWWVALLVGGGILRRRRAAR